jgi:carboxypeptidase Q
MDLYDRLVPENLIVNSVIIATFVYHAAMRDEKLPRVWPLPW